MTVKSLAPEGEDGKKAKATIAIAPDCSLGEHVLRLRTKSGLSQARSFWIGQYPGVQEAEPNTEFATPQRIEANTTVEGVIGNEDVDYFVVSAKKGQILSTEVEGVRLGREFDGRFLDPYVAIMNMERFELASADDTALLMQDGFASIVVPEDGDYVIELRDASYEGNDRNRYRLHVGNFPRPTAIYPPGGKVGEQREFRLLGAASGETTPTITLPSEPDDKFGVFAESEGARSPSPNWLRVTTLDDVSETEPNNSRNEASAGVALPFAFNGIIASPGDEDWFKFAAKKGQKFSVRAYARSIRSPLDSVLNVYDKDGKSLAGNDDQAGLDSRFDWTAPEDGEYFLRIRDHLNNGGPNYIYRIEADAPTPSLVVSIPQFARRDYQSRQMIYPARGNRTAIVINAARNSFGGDLIFEAANLPEGVTMHVEEMPGNVNAWPNRLRGRARRAGCRPTRRACRAAQGETPRSADTTGKTSISSSPAPTTPSTTGPPPTRWLRR